MGHFHSRQNAGVEEVAITVNHAYKYPPRTGHYFSNHFIMGGERFDTAHPEMYLFGENSDLNFLGTRPMPFPYPAPPSCEPSRTLRALINVRKESLRFVRVPDNSAALKENDSQSTCFNIEFTFDCDVRCAITIMYLCTEEIGANGLLYFSVPVPFEDFIGVVRIMLFREGYTPKDANMNSATYHYKSGANQQFSQVLHVFNPSQFTEEELTHSFDKDQMPVVIYCQTEDDTETEQVHATIATVERYSDGYTLKPLKQKLHVDGLCYLLQEIYGIENKNVDNSKTTADDDQDDNGAECVICMCDLRDTLILPCRHLCLCYSCADSLRFQANNCPICRAPFRALLQIKALQKISNQEINTAECTEANLLGYEAVSLIEALNGPSENSGSPAATETSATNKDGEAKAKTSAVEESGTQTDYHGSSSDNETYKPGSQIRMSTLLAQEECEKNMEDLNAKGDVKRRKSSSKDDTVLCVNETKNGTNGVLHRRLKKSMSASTPTTQSNESTKVDMKMYRSESHGIDDPSERLGLLDTNVESKETTPPCEKGTDVRRSHSFRDTMDSRYTDRLSGYSKKHHPVRRHSSRRTPQKVDSDNLTTGETQSLPGTPLSTTSAVSRSSDASVSSASSTRALIISHPSHGANSAV